MDEEKARLVRERLCLALDSDDSQFALFLMNELRSYFAVAKVGLELFSAAGPKVVEQLCSAQVKIFVDLKLHDIPTTVRKAARALGQLGVSYVTMHACGGLDMLSAGVEGLHDGAARKGVPAPVALAVTVLTSDELASPSLVLERAELALRAGCGGVVCAASDLELLGELGQPLFKVVPGIRLAGGSRDDQVRVASPQSALRAGADLLVVGRAVTAAADRDAAAAAILADAAAGI